MNVSMRVLARRQDLAVTARGADPLLAPIRHVDAKSALRRAAAALPRRVKQYRRVTLLLLLMSICIGAVLFMTPRFYGDMRRIRLGRYLKNRFLVSSFGASNCTSGKPPVECLIFHGSKSFRERGQARC
jgi:hypothetical protein